MASFGPDPDPVFGIASVAIPALVVVVFVGIVVLTAYRGVRLARRGVNPLTLQEDVATRVLRSETLAPARSKADRLAELDSLRATGSISADEHATARGRILAE